MFLHIFFLSCVDIVARRFSDILSLPPPSTPRALEVERGGEMVRQATLRVRAGARTENSCATPHAPFPECFSVARCAPVFARHRVAFCRGTFCFVFLRRHGRRLGALFFAVFLFRFFVGCVSFSHFAFPISTSGSTPNVAFRLFLSRRSLECFRRTMSPAILFPRPRWGKEIYPGRRRGTLKKFL